MHMFICSSRFSNGFVEEVLRQLKRIKWLFEAGHELVISDMLLTQGQIVPTVFTVPVCY